MSNTQLPAIPAIPADASPEMNQFLSAIKQILEVRTGVVGDPLDVGVTFNDLLDSQIMSLAQSSYSGASNAVDLVVPAYTPPTADLTPPPAPSALTATAALSNVILRWTNPVDENYSHAKVYRADASSFVGEVQIATVEGEVFSDAVGASGVARYYRLKGVSVAGIDSIAYSSSANATTGLVGGVDLSPLIIDASKLASGAVTATKIGAAAIGSAAIQNGAITNALIGNAAIDDAKIASLSADKINAGTITAARIAADSITGDKLNVTGLDAKLATISSAYVNTLNIAGDAITVPRAALAPALITLSSTSYTELVSTTIDSGGQPVNVTISVPYYITNTSSGTVGNIVSVRVLRNGVDLFAPEASLGWALSGGLLLTIASGSNTVVKTDVISGTLKDSPGVGTHTYSILAQKFLASGTALVWNASLQLLGVKR